MSYSMVKNFQSKLKDITDIKERNKAFDALSPEDKRREIAWDALLLLMKSKTKGSHKFFWSSHLLQLLTNDAEETQRNLLNDANFINRYDCQVCAKGALMLSRIRLGNSICLTETNTRETISRADGIGTFSRKSLDIMEVFYETYEENYVTHDFGYNTQTYPYDNNTNTRLICILGNIIVNGDFDPTDYKDYYLY